VIIPSKKPKKLTRKHVATTFLILATFFNPLGFDALFALIMKWTGSFWLTDSIFYALSLLFFGAYYFMSRSNKD
jgi:hypothetical protein